MPSNEERDIAYQNYVRANGNRALRTFVSANESYVVKRETDDCVIVVKISDLSEHTIGLIDFEENFMGYFSDETPLYMGLPGHYADALRDQIKAECKAIEFCVFGQPAGVLESREAIAKLTVNQ